MYQLIIKCSTAPFIFKQVFNINFTSNIIFSPDTYLPVVYDYVVVVFFKLFGILRINDFLSCLSLFRIAFKHHNHDTY